MKANKNELAAALSSSMLTSLVYDSTDAGNMLDIVGVFQTGSQGGVNALEGEVWNSIRSKFTEFKTVLEQRKKVSQELASDIKGAIKSVYDCMGDYEVLDYTLLDDIKATEVELKRSIDYAQTHINDKVSKKVLQSDGTYVQKYVDLYSDAEKSQMQKDINTWTDELAAAEKLINKLDEFAGVYAKAEQQLASCYEKITSFGNMVSNVKIGKKVAYVKAANV